MSKTKKSVVTVQGTRATQTKEVTLAPKKKKAKSEISQAKSKLVSLWNNEHLKANKIVAFFKSDNPQIKKVVQNFVDAVNKANKSNYNISNITPQLVRDFSFPYEVNPTEMNAKKTGLIYDVENRKNYFSPNYILGLFQRKAKYGTPTNEAFIKYSKERCEVKLCNMIEAEARALLIAKLLTEHEAKA
jgi:hypothetical protein